MMSSKIVVCFVIILLFWSMFIAYSRHKVEIFLSGNIFSYSKIKPMLKTGDIILFMCTKHENIFEEFKYYLRTQMVDCPYGHVGLIFKCNKKIYVIECTGEDKCGESDAVYLTNVGRTMYKSSKDGMRIIELEDLIRIYSNDYGGIFSIKFIQDEIPNNVIINSVKQIYSPEFENMFYLALLGTVDNFISNEFASQIANKYKSEKIFCGEFIYRILYNCGILKKYNPKLVWPHTYNSKLFENLQNVKYSHSVPFKY